MITTNRLRQILRQHEQLLAAPQFNGKQNRVRDLFAELDRGNPPAVTIGTPPAEFDTDDHRAMRWITRLGTRAWMIETRGGITPTGSPSIRKLDERRADGSVADFVNVSVGEIDDDAVNRLCAASAEYVEALIEQQEYMDVPRDEWEVHASMTALYVAYWNGALQHEPGFRQTTKTSANAQIGKGRAKFDAGKRGGLRYRRRGGEYEYPLGVFMSWLQSRVEKHRMTLIGEHLAESEIDGFL